MKAYVQLMALLIATLFVTGCSGMIRLSETEQSHPIPEGISEEQLKSSIMEGAYIAGWTATDSNSISILATYQERIHTVNVGVYFSTTDYRVLYDSSKNMKVYCTEKDKSKNKISLTGRDICPGNLAPLYIRSTYKSWIENLVRYIDAAL